MKRCAKAEERGAEVDVSYGANQSYEEPSEARYLLLLSNCQERSEPLRRRRMLAAASVQIAACYDVVYAGFRRCLPRCLMPP